MRPDQGVCFAPGRAGAGQIEIKRVIAEGVLVATRSHLILEPGKPGRALADFFRLENGKVVEHWDVIQDVPEGAANDNGMF